MLASGLNQTPLLASLAFMDGADDYSRAMGRPLANNPPKPRHQHQHQHQNPNLLVLPDGILAFTVIWQL